ncbi:BTB domain-containing protein [Mycena kentingensis (nom. inval.)]|nr:BTB domain-containing protein [Mycena kentingensis (nom. inval.)]
MSTGDRPAKRPCDNGPEPESAITRSPDYWFDDGSIVLQVESTQFRIAKSMLARHSSVFKDMLSLPLPSDEPLIEGCPVVVLPDSSADWTRLLEVMYPKRQVGFPGPNEVPTFEQLAAVLRLSKKYDIPELRRQCVARLKDSFPSTLAGFDKALENLEAPSNMSYIAFYAAVVNLARTVGLWSVLPPVFYSIATLFLEDGMHSKELENLELADELVCFRGRSKMTALFPAQSPFKWMDPKSKLIPCGQCKHQKSCQTAISDIRANILVGNQYLAWIAMPWSEYLEGKLCDKCIVAAQEVHENMREECWKALPSYFGLPPWDELFKMDSYLD